MSLLDEPSLQAFRGKFSLVIDSECKANGSQLIGHKLTGNRATIILSLMHVVAGLIDVAYM